MAVPRWLFVLVALALWPRAAHATFSIVACAKDGTCGAAVATNNLAVGASVIYAKARVGALASQFETNPGHGPKGLALLESGKAAQAALDEVLKADGNFEGQGIEFRQVGVVGMAGAGAAYTGKEAAGSPWAGALTGPGYSIQGNGLAGRAVVEAMQAAFVRAPGSLAERMLAAIAAGEAAGGQATGRLSAALLVRTPDGGFADIDLRVDAAARPIDELRRLLDMHLANDAIIRAERAARSGDRGLAHKQLAEALQRGAGWDRILRRGARLAISLGEIDHAVSLYAAFLHVNEVWARRELDDAFYAPLWPALQRWRPCAAKPPCAKP